ncbi:hypothetical protein A3Q56_06572 [Intoshia linei]|uniref:Uncharacterized protein n=1 Tax=Intoshia linei TaxID=1819745 RepID=A0A177AWC9_9BILA|nr:hypothetical protein A3Q56_06572 [Intoshia linei]
MTYLPRYILILFTINFIKFKFVQIQILVEEVLQDSDQTESISRLPPDNNGQLKDEDIDENDLAKGMDIFSDDVAGELEVSCLSSHDEPLSLKKLMFVLHCISKNVSVMASWRIYQQEENLKDTHLRFRSDLAVYLVKYSSNLSNRNILSGPSSKIPDELRYDGMQHYLVNNNKQTKCIDKNDDRLPNVICSNCQKIVHEYGNGIFSRKIEIFDHFKVTINFKRNTRSSLNKTCSCTICLSQLSFNFNSNNGVPKYFKIF